MVSMLLFEQVTLTTLERQHCQPMASQLAKICNIWKVAQLHARVWLESTSELQLVGIQKTPLKDDQIQGEMDLLLCHSVGIQRTPLKNDQIQG